MKTTFQSNVTTETNRRITFLRVRLIFYCILQLQCLIIFSSEMRTHYVKEWNQEEGRLTEMPLVCNVNADVEGFFLMVEWFAAEPDVLKVFVMILPLRRISTWYIPSCCDSLELSFCRPRWLRAIRHVREQERGL